MFRKLLAGFLLMSALVFAGVLRLGGDLIDPRQCPIKAPATSLALETIKIPTDNGHSIEGWFVPGQSDKPGVLLLHSVRSNRLEMIARAEFLNRAGYSVLLIDMQAHGETLGEHITFGYRESFDAHAALNYLKMRVPGRKVGVIGVSLGGAAALLGEAPLNADAVVLEAVYSSIENAIANRLALRFGDVGRMFSPLLAWQIEPRLGIASESLAPISAIRHLASPVLIVAGEDDQHTLSEESKRFFRAASEPKELWLIAGAEHQNFHRYNPAAYEMRILAFFSKYLAGSDA